MTLSSTATSGAKATESSSWKQEHSQITVASGIERPGQRGQRGADVAGDDVRLAGLGPDVAEPLGHRRLAVGAGQRDEAVRQQRPAQLELADHRHPPLPGRGHDGGLRGNAGALDQCAHALEQVGPVTIQLNFDAQRRKPAATGRTSGIGAVHALPPRQQRLGGGDARSGRARRRGRGPGGRGGRGRWKPWSEVRRGAGGSPSRAWSEEREPTKLAQRRERFQARARAATASSERA